MPCGCHERRQFARAAYDAARRRDRQAVAENTSALRQSLSGDMHYAMQELRTGVARYVPATGRYQRP